MQVSDAFEKFAEEFREHPEILDSALIGLGKILKILASLNESGVLDALSEALSNKEILDNLKNASKNSLTNLILLLNVFGAIDSTKFKTYSSKLPKAIKESLEEFEKEHKGIGILGILSLAKKEEFASLIRALEVFLKNMK
jgi:uncharacterized protein YjgD (DUF1641 family)